MTASYFLIIKKARTKEIEYTRMRAFSGLVFISPSARYRSPAENQSVREWARGKLVGARVDFSAGRRHGL